MASWNQRERKNKKSGQLNWRSVMRRAKTWRQLLNKEGITEKS